MVRNLWTLSGAALCALLLSAPLALGQQTPEEKKGQEIMKAVNDLPQLEMVRTEAELRIYDKQSNLLFTKKFRGATFFKDYGKPDVRLQRSINYFYEPPDDKGNSSLVAEHVNSDDDEQYLYLKQTRKVRRIIGSAKKDDFFGSDFSNGDVTRRRYEDYNFKWLGEDKITFKGKQLTVQKIESQFKNPTKRDDWGEGKSIVWVHPESGLVFRAERYDLQMQLHKISTLEEFQKWPNRDGKPVFLVAQIKMQNLNRGTWSEFIIRERKYEKDAGVDPAIFVQDSLTKQWW